VGAFGLLDANHDDPTPPERLTSSHASIDVFEAYRQGLTIEGASGRLKTGFTPCQVSVRTPGILEIDGVPVRLVSHKCLPAPAFLCPVCEKDCYRIYDVGGWRCRKCANLTYASRCRNRSIPDFARLRYLRRRLGALEAPFAPLPPVLPQHRRRWKLVAEIRKIEAGLCSHAADISATLERRYGRDRRR